MSEPAVIYNPEREIENKVSVPNPIQLDPGCKTFSVKNEDHTLANALRYVIMKNPVVEFCGYSIPHPSEHNFNLRIQTHPDSPQTASDVLDKGLDDLVDMCTHIEAVFGRELEEFQR